MQVAGKLNVGTKFVAKLPHSTFHDSRDTNSRTPPSPFSIHSTHNSLTHNSHYILTHSHYILSSCILFLILYTYYSPVNYLYYLLIYIVFFIVYILKGFNIYFNTSTQDKYIGKSRVYRVRDSYRNEIATPDRDSYRVGKHHSGVEDG